MSVHILYDREEGLACLYESVTREAFGPVAGYSDGTHPTDQLRLFMRWAELRDVPLAMEVWKIYQQERATR